MKAELPVFHIERIVFAARRLTQSLVYETSMLGCHTKEKGLPGCIPRLYSTQGVRQPHQFADSLEYAGHVNGRLYLRLNCSTELLESQWGY